MRTFNVLLVDDEILALNGLEKGMDWASLRCGEPYTALSLSDAIHTLQSESVDIVITDIEMPGGSGLELIRWLREHKPDIKPVISTGHAEFSYAREALRMGVEDYLLKPVSYHDLESVMTRIQSKILAAEEDTLLPENAPPGVSGHEIVEQVQRIIGENLAQDNLQRDELAALVHVSPGYLGRLFKKETGLPLADYITRKRMVLARQLLVKTNLSVTDIATRVGFSYASYFTRIFKEQVGMTPQEYRQQTKK